MSRAQRAATQLLVFAGNQLQQWRGAKAVPTKLTVELLKDVAGVGDAGQLVRINHGYARNFLVPNRLAVALARPRRRRQAAATQAVSSSSTWEHDTGSTQSTPSQQILEKQQQQFDKLIETLTRATLTLKRRTKDGQMLEQPLQAEDIAEAVARQLRIQLVPDMVDLAGDVLSVVGEYRLPLKLELASGERAMLDVSVSST